MGYCQRNNTYSCCKEYSTGETKSIYCTLDCSLMSEEEKLLDDASAKVTGFVTLDKDWFPQKDVNTGSVMYDS